MRYIKRSTFALFIGLLLIILNIGIGYAQKSKLPQTPLPDKILNILSNEISGQVIFNNEVILAGATWIRDKVEFTSGNMYESKKIVELVKGYGINTVKLEKTKRKRKTNYPFQGEFWITKPHKRLIARLDADAALVCNGSKSVDLTAPLIYIPPLDKNTLKKGFSTKVKKNHKGKIALMWRQPWGKEADLLDQAGIQGVISFGARDRYSDPNQVVYSYTNTKKKKNLKFGFMISWRQWTELLEDLEGNLQVEAHCKARIEEFDDKFETVLAWIPGTEPNKKGVMFSAHLFEGYVKRGANDNISGCVVQLEILRVLTKLIKNRVIPQPKRNIYFLWPNEISGTFEFFKNNISLMKNISSNINMDMVGEGQRKNNALFTFAECPNYLPSYLDGLGNSILNYLWRGNDIVYLPDSPRGRRGQYFPKPMWEKNGSTDAFRYDIHLATGGSDHICFKSPTVGIPGVELNVWPDQWYHADTDTPDKSDPTQLKRSAFIGAAMVLSIADCTDQVLNPLLKAISNFGYLRIGERELPRALNLLVEATKDNLSKKFGQALTLIEIAGNREIGAIRSVKEIYSDSKKAQDLVQMYLNQWKFYQNSLTKQINYFAHIRYDKFQIPFSEPTLSEEEKKMDLLIPTFSDQVKYKEFSLRRSQLYKDYMKKKEAADKKKKKKKKARKEPQLNYRESGTIFNYINGERSVLTILRYTSAEMGKNVDPKLVVKFIKLLEEVGFIKKL